MDFGMPTLIELPEIPDCAALCRQLGLQFVELNMNLPQYQVNALDEEQLLRTAKRENIYYTVHLDKRWTPAISTPGWRKPGRKPCWKPSALQSGWVLRS